MSVEQRAQEVKRIRISEKQMAENKMQSYWIRWILVATGIILVGLGTLGILLPLLPTTPFFLLAALCFAKSSKRFYCWLLNNRWFGSYIKNYREGKGVPLRVKATTIALLWVTILFSAIFVLSILFVRIILIIIAIAVTLHIMLIRPGKSRVN